MSTISKKILGDPKKYTEIQKINPQITNPDKIQVGMKINVPKLSEAKQPIEQITENVAPTADIWAELKAEISKGEGNYYSYNRGVAGDTPKAKVDITQLTVGQIMKMQNTIGPDNKKLLFAVGKYQMIPSTLAEAVKNPRVGVSTGDMFTPDVQEKLFMHLMYKRKNLMAYIDGKSNDINAAINDLAAEFASLPTTSGRGRYDKDKAGNKASGGLKRVEKIKAILSNLRQTH